MKPNPFNGIPHLEDEPYLGDYLVLGYYNDEKTYEIHAQTHTAEGALKHILTYGHRKSCVVKIIRSLED